MKIIYKALDGREFDTEEKCIKHENKLLKLKRVFDKFVDEGVFPNYKIPTFYHNYDVSSLGKPSKSDWSYRYRGYVLVHGRMGNGDTVVSFKIRGNKLLVFRWDTDDSESEGRKYLGSIVINDRLEKIKKIKEKITS